MEGRCCICEEWASNIYSSMKHYSDGEIRRFSGHRECLDGLDKLLIDEVEVEYVLINKGYIY